MNALDLFWDRCEGPIVYGVNDCCMTLADVILAAGGPDLMASYRGRYRTRLGFVRAIRKAGHATLADAVSVKLKSEGVRVNMPEPFDVGIVTYLKGGEPVHSPAFFHSDFWFVRTETGGLVAAVTLSTSIWRVIHA